MKRSLDNSVNIDDVLNTDSLNIENEQKKRKIVKTNGEIKFSTYYYEMKKLLGLFSLFGKSVRFKCTKTNMVITMTDKITHKNAPTNSFFDGLGNGQLISFNLDDAQSNLNDDTDDQPKSEQISNIGMFALFEDSQLHNFTTNLLDDEIYEANVAINNLLDSLNDLNFTTDSLFTIEMSFNETNPYIKITKTISDDETFVSSFTEIKMTSVQVTKHQNPHVLSSKKRKNKPNQTENSEVIDKLNVKTDTKADTKAEQNLSINFDKMTFSTTIKTSKLFEIVKTIGKTPTKLTANCNPEEIKFKWDVKNKKTPPKSFSYTLKNSENLCNIICESNSKSNSETTNINMTEKTFSLTNFHNLIRYMILLSVDTTLHFFSDSKFMVTGFVGNIGKLVVELD